MDTIVNELLYLSFSVSQQHSLEGKKERNMERQANNVKAIGRKSRKKEIKD